MTCRSTSSRVLDDMVNSGARTAGAAPRLGSMRPKPARAWSSPASRRADRRREPATSGDEVMEVAGGKPRGPRWSLPAQSGPAANAGVRRPIKLCARPRTKEVQVLSADRSGFLKNRTCTKQSGSDPCRFAVPVLSTRFAPRRSDRVAHSSPAEWRRHGGSSVCSSSAVGSRTPSRCARDARMNSAWPAQSMESIRARCCPHSWTGDTGRGAERFGRPHRIELDVSIAATDCMGCIDHAERKRPPTNVRSCP